MWLWEQNKVGTSKSNNPEYFNKIINVNMMNERNIIIYVKIVIEKPTGNTAKNGKGKYFEKL